MAFRISSQDDSDTSKSDFSIRASSLAISARTPSEAVSQEWHGKLAMRCLIWSTQARAVIFSRPFSTVRHSMYGHL